MKKISIYDNNNYLKFIKDIPLKDHEFLFFEKTDDHLFDKEKFISSSRNIILVFDDMESFSILTGSLKSLTERNIDSLCVVSKFDVKNLLIFGDDEETIIAASSINSGSFKIISLDEMDLVEKYVYALCEYNFLLN